MTEAKPGTLYVVATPIGNLEDITLRAIRVLGEADAIACEDTRVSSKLLHHLGVQKRLISYYYPKEQRKKEAVLELLREGRSVALITDSGTPGISDPGAVLVAAAHAEGCRVVTIPGPSAVAASISVSGIEGRGFHFAGFLPETQQARREELQKLARMDVPVVIYVGPHDLSRLLDDLLRYFGDRPLVLAREMTKKFEEVRRTSVADMRGRLSDAPKGEFVLVVEPGAVPEVVQPGLDVRFRELLAQGLSRAQAVKTLSRETSLSKRRVAEIIGD
ncbi:MAG: 16S rRNA (cytidine(1402)-2'-O)-methyltransferase [Acidobacteriota bacterium]